MSIRRRLALMICPELGRPARPTREELGCEAFEFYDVGAVRRIAREFKASRLPQGAEVTPVFRSVRVKERQSDEPTQMGSLLHQDTGSFALSNQNVPTPILGQAHRSGECPAAGSDAKACWLCNPEPPGPARSMSGANLGFRYMTGGQE
ncbi:hypothetical protein KZZ08_17400 [Roseovarius mucosus]|uniref:Uncharacterized protein n=1 Tax=Roseovarius mucosus TaxID=215743 RepID=A0A1V0RT84_9RHOB|nr:hypothetical protein [Roseovarius mucosus]ARE84987.1 hypothetical protein ROSMUCSMR3_03533 [Roseovarius mucosus]MBW4975410.1 hypothetical protein [Roseovarius mucosus]